MNIIIKSIFFIKIAFFIGSFPGKRSNSEYSLDGEIAEMKEMENDIKRGKYKKIQKENIKKEKFLIKKTKYKKELSIIFEDEEGALPPNDQNIEKIYHNILKAQKYRGFWKDDNYKNWKNWKKISKKKLKLFDSHGMPVYENKNSNFCHNKTKIVYLSGDRDMHSGNYKFKGFDEYKKRIGTFSIFPFKYIYK